MSPLTPPEVIEVGADEAEALAGALRVAQAVARRPSERVPVLLSFAQAFKITRTGAGVTFPEYFGDPEAQLRTQLVAAAWIQEHVRADMAAEPPATDFANAREASALGADVVFPDDNIPWVRGPWIDGDDDLARLRDVDPVHHGLHGREIEWKAAMEAAADRHPLRYRGGELQYPGRHVSTSHGHTDGPFTVAAEIRGLTRILTDVYENPAFLHRLLDVVTDKIVACIDHARAAWGPAPLSFFADDFAVNLSPGHFREFSLPYLRRIRAHIPGLAVYHMCGRADHVVPLVVDELDIAMWHGLGFEVDRRRAREAMEGRCAMHGNVSPLTLALGTAEDVRRECHEILADLGDMDGFVMGDGNNVPPASPLENVNAIWRAVCEHAGTSATTATTDRQEER